jgi:tetratricopeptide (TPR) repeat protein
MVSVLVGEALARIGSRQEALQKMQAGIDLYESVLKGGADINTERDLGISKTKRGAIQLMDGDFPAALASFHEARAILEPMAKVDPQNNMLQLDMAGMDYEEGRLLASTGRYAAAILPLQKAIQAYQALRAQGRDGTDIGPLLGASYIWLGEAEAGERHLRRALENYRKASAEMQSPAGRLVPDDTLCQLATSYVKAGDVLTKMGSVEEASAAYEKALDIVTPLVSPERRDVPALYPAADAYAGLGDVSATRAHRVQTQLWSEALTWYEKSLHTWQNIPNPSGIGPAGFKARDPQEIARRLAECKSATR